MKLQEFIEINAGKSFGQTFIYERMIVCTANLRCVTVSVYISGLEWTFVRPFDETELDNSKGEKVAFYYWLKDFFFPKMRDDLIKYVLKHNESMVGQE